MSREALDHELAYLHARLREAMYLQRALAGIVVIVAGVILLLIDSFNPDWNLSWPTLIGFVVAAAILLTLAHRIPLRDAQHIEAKILSVRTMADGLAEEPEPDCPPLPLERP